jgi:SAM-dependent methyltransferase
VLNPSSLTNDTLKRLLPFYLRRWLRQKERELKHSLLPTLRVRDFESLRRVTPIRQNFGYGWGQCIDRYYIEQFLSRYAVDIQGHVLEFQNDAYTRKFDGRRVTRRDILHDSIGNPEATIVADLTCADHIPSNTFDCIICTQVLLLIYDIRAAIAALYRILKPGGVLLVTVPGVAHKISRYDIEHGGDYWRFTSLSLKRLFEEFFPSENVRVEAYGNVLAAICFLHGLVAEELRPDELDYHDAEYEVSITARAVKPACPPQRNDTSTK